MVSTTANRPKPTEAPVAHATVRRVPVLDWNPACGFHMAAQYFSQAAYILELAQGSGEKVSPEEALEAAAVQLSCQLELSPECMIRVKAVLREAERALDGQ